MKSIRTMALVLGFCITLGLSANAQETIRTVFRKGIYSSGGYGAITNKFTRIGGEFANLSGIYGGWYINHRFMIGIGGAALTSNIKVPLQYRTDPDRNTSYEYGQFGLMTEYVIGSGKPVHFVAQLFGGAGFTLQYERNGWHGTGGFDSHITDENWFVVAEPGMQVEVNLFRWMRFSPGVSYRVAFGSGAAGLRDKDISNMTYSATLKFGRF